MGKTYTSETYNHLLAEFTECYSTFDLITLEKLRAKEYARLDDLNHVFRTLL